MLLLSCARCVHCEAAATKLPLGHCTLDSYCALPCTVRMQAGCCFQHKQCTGLRQLWFKPVQRTPQVSCGLKQAALPRRKRSLIEIYKCPTQLSAKLYRKLMLTQTTAVHRSQ